MQAEGREKLEGPVLADFNRALLNAAFRGIGPRARLEATQINPRHAEIIATSSKAKDQAATMFSAFWSLLLTCGTVLMVSLFTNPSRIAS